jgi:hypothetical protein
MIAAPSEITKVPVTSGRTPKLLGSNRGAQVVPPKKSNKETSAKNPMVSPKSTAMMPKVTATHRAAQINVAFRTKDSCRWALLTLAKFMASPS